MGRVHFLDTSALVKALVKEQGSGRIEPLIEAGPPFYTSELCVAETLGVLKAKFIRNELTEHTYFKTAYYLTALLKSSKLHIKSLPITDSDVYFEAMELGKRHKLDLADALQLVTLLRYSIESRLITADQELAAAARAEGLEVWDCLRELAPNME